MLNQAKGAGANTARALISTLAIFAVCAACSGDHDTGGGAQTAGGPEQGEQAQATAVEVMTVSRQRIESTREIPGRARAYAEAEIRPQVTGLIESRLFKEGEYVEAGQALYQIESSEYSASVQSASASLERAEATAAAARETAKRFQRLAEINAVSQQEYDEADAARKQAEADIAIQRAALDRARIDLARTRLRAPISGQIGRSNVTQGALVTQNQANPLARVLQLDPIYVDLTAASSEMLKWKRDVAEGNIETSDDGAVALEIELENDTPYPYQGELEFSEVSVDENAGSVIIRAVVPNPDGLLLPGMFVKARFSAGEYDSVVAVPQSAILRTPRGDPYALVMEDGTARQRMLDVIEAQDNQWIIRSGLEAGDQLITGGLQNLRPGMPVRLAAEATAQAQAGAPMREE